MWMYDHDSDHHLNGVWSNGMTSDFGSGNLGSNPSTPAIQSKDNK